MKARKILVLAAIFLCIFSGIAYSENWFVKTKKAVMGKLWTLWGSGEVTTEEVESSEEIVESARVSVPAYNFDTYKKKAVWSVSTKSKTGYVVVLQEAGQIMYYDGKKVIAIEGAYGILPRISKAGITYIDPKTQDFYFYDGNTITKLGKIHKSNIDSADTNRYTSYMSKYKIAWFKNVGNPFQSEVMVYDIKTGIKKQLTYGNIQSNYNATPVVEGKYVAWTNVRQGDYGDSTIDLYDGHQVKTIAKSKGLSIPIFTNKNQIIYSIIEKENRKVNCFSYNIKSGKTKQLTLDKFNKELEGKY